MKIIQLIIERLLQAYIAHEARYGLPSIVW